MKFEQAIEKLKNGARITRKGWKNNVRSTFSVKATSRGKFEIENGIGQTDIQDSLPINYADCIADDWEIVIDPKDYKIYISNQGELYINGKKISNNCSYTLTDYIDDSKPREQALMERTAKIDISFIVNVDECAFEG